MHLPAPASTPDLCAIQDIFKLTRGAIPAPTRVAGSNVGGSRCAALPERRTSRTARLPLLSPDANAIAGRFQNRGFFSPRPACCDRFPNSCPFRCVVDFIGLGQFRTTTVDMFTLPLTEVCTSNVWAAAWRHRRSLVSLHRSILGCLQNIHLQTACITTGLSLRSPSRASTLLSGRSRRSPTGPRR